MTSTILKSKQEKLDVLLQDQGKQVLKNLAKPWVDVNDGTYYLCGLAHDAIKMLRSIIYRNMPAEQAALTFQIALETVLLDYGMSIKIDTKAL